MENKGIKIIKVIIQLVIAVACMLMGVIWLPSFSAWIFLLLGVAILPIKPLDNFFEKHKIGFGIRVTAVIVLFIVTTLFFTGSGSSGGGGAAGGGGTAGGDSTEINIAGTWKYVVEPAIDCDYKFNSDGTFRYNSEGGAWDEGTYVIEDGVIKTTGQFYNEEFKIIDKKTIENAYGERLKRK